MYSVEFEAGIRHADHTNQNYTQKWRINFAEWNNPTQPKLLETLVDLNYSKDNELLTISTEIELKMLLTVRS